MPFEYPYEQDTKFRIKLSVIRQETVVVSAQSTAQACAKIQTMLMLQASDQDASLEHFVVCSVEEELG